ncbi:MAG: alpha/beta hydrolase [Myxococcota bacterium]
MAPQAIVTTMPCLDEGRGPPVVFLHGAPDHKESWRAVIDQVRHHHRCIAPDLPGFGASIPLPRDYDWSIASQATWLDAFISDRLGDTPITLVLHDIGAMMGLAWAAQHPARVAGIVVMNVVFHTDYRWHGFARTMASPLRSALFMKFVTRGLFVRSFRRDFPRVSRAHAERIYAGMMTPAARSSLPRLFRAMTRPGYFDGWQERLEAITRQIPTRVLWGRHDPMIPVEYAHRVGDDVRMLDDCGHWVPLVKPEAVAKAVEHLGQARPNAASS